MTDRYAHLTIWVTETYSIFKTSVSDNENILVGNVPWNRPKEGELFRDVMGVLGNDGWQIVSRSLPDENGNSCFILSKKV